MKVEPKDIVDLEEKQLRTSLKQVMRLADKHGFLGIKTDGKRASYIVSAKFWRVGVVN